MHMDCMGLYWELTAGGGGAGRPVRLSLSATGGLDQVVKVAASGSVLN
jgi:hypothetical protein